MCDPVIDEHFRRSLGKDYMNLFSSDSSTTNNSNNNSNNSNGNSSITVTGLSGKKSSASLYYVCLLYVQGDSLDRGPRLITVNHTLIYHWKRNWHHCVLWNTDPVPFCVIYAIPFCLWFHMCGKIKYMTEQHVFLICLYWVMGSFIQCQAAFRNHFLIATPSRQKLGTKEPSD